MKRDKVLNTKQRRLSYLAFKYQQWMIIVKIFITIFFLYILHLCDKLDIVHFLLDVNLLISELFLIIYMNIFSIRYLKIKKQYVIHELIDY